MTPSKDAWYLKPWVVLLLLFVVLGPFGLPFLYKSPHFNRFWKMVLTALTLLYTAYVVVATIQILQLILSRLTQAINL